MTQNQDIMAVMPRKNPHAECRKIDVWAFDHQGETRWVWSCNGSTDEASYPTAVAALAVASAAHDASNP